MKKVLFLCTGNSCRSQMAEAILNNAAHGKYQAFSAGSEPKDHVHPYTLQLFDLEGFDTEQVKPKNMEPFIGQEIDFVITLCDKMHENCPVFPSKPLYAHWGMPDPASYKGTEDEIKAFFKKTYLEIANRIHMFMLIDMKNMDRADIEAELGDIANTWKYID